MRRPLFVLLIVAAGFTSAAPALSNDAMSPDAIFTRARSIWHARDDAPYVRYALRERYTWRSLTHDNWWQAAYRGRDGALALHRQIVAEQEQARLRGTPITLNLKFHSGLARADSLDTNPAADAFPILDPEIEPDASFGLRHSSQAAVLTGGAGATARPTTDASTPPPTPEPTPSSVPAPNETPLRVLATVEAASRDYKIELAGMERVRDTDAYHLTLTPLRDPHVYRLRDLWVATGTFETLQLAVAGLFDGEPYESARWIVSYVDIGGRPYVQQIRTDDQLRFGMDRFVSGLQFDFVQYAFPESLPALTFEKYL